MRKIPTAFQRDFNGDHRAPSRTRQHVPSRFLVGRSSFVWVLGGFPIRRDGAALAGALVDFDVKASPRMSWSPTASSPSMASRSGPLSFAAVGDYLAKHVVEGVVWWHPDGRMAKAKRRDFGHPWPAEVTA